MADLKLVPDRPAMPAEERPLKGVELDGMMAKRTLLAGAQADAIAEANAFGAQIREIDREVATRMAEAKSKRLPHPTLKIYLEPKTTLTKIESEFLDILELTDVPQSEKDEMVTRIVPTTPVVKTDATKLKKYADQYGPEHPLHGIRERALRYDTTYALRIEPVEEPKKGLEAAHRHEGLPDGS